MTYKYPFPVPWIKIGLRILLPVLILFCAAMIFIQKVENYNSLVDYLFLIAVLAFFPFPFFLLLYSWCDIRIEENGVWVEFLSRELWIPWEDIANVQFVGAGPRFTGVWFVRTKNQRLTPFHVAYGLFYARSLARGFVIHPGITGEKELIRRLRKGK